MSFIKSNIPFSETNYFSKIALDYINQKDTLKGFIQQFPSKEALAQQMLLKSNDGVDRQVLQQVLQDQYRQIAMHEKVQQHISLITNKNTFTICTAHQPCIFTGPLYVIYKISHAIKMAEACKELFPDKHFVPVYYMGSEDNDLDEIGTMHLYDKTLKWDTHQTGACGSMSTKDLEPLTREVLAILNTEIADEKWLAELLQRAYMNGHTLAEATRVFINGLFESYGLLIIDGNDVQLKRMFSAIMKDELLHQHSSRLVHETGKLLGENYKVQAAGRDINLFYLTEGIRERIEKTDIGWMVHNTDQLFTIETLTAALNEHPEVFSPNVILRPLYQEMILPNIAFIGGGGELAYWLELKKIFDHYKVTYPLIFLRNSFLIIDKESEEIRNRLNITVGDLFLQKAILYKHLLANSETLLELENKIEILEKSWLEIEELGQSVNVNLSVSMKAHHAKSNRISDRIRQKFIAHLKRNESDKMQLADKIKELLFPANSLQERYDNFIPYFKKYGRNFIAELLVSQTGIDSEFVVLTEE